MQGHIVGMLAETSIHAGTGRSQSVIDLPVAREETTRYPMIPGSSLKGSLKDKANQERPEIVDRVFGKSDAAGRIGITDARLLLLPVRSLSGHYRWVTCPYLLERLQRDFALARREMPVFTFSIQSGQALMAQDQQMLFLEELSYTVVQDTEMMKQIAEVIFPLIPHDSVRRRLEQQLVVISDEDFAHFAQFGLPIRARNQLNDKTKESENLWYEETLPPDTLLYLMLIARHGNEDTLQQIKTCLQMQPYFQAGGNETLGQGWFLTSVVE